MPTTRIQIGLSGSRIPPEELAYYNSIKKPFKEPQGHWEYFIIKPNDENEWKALKQRLGPYVSFGREWTRESKETKFMSEMSRLAAILKEFDQQSSVAETADVTDYEPKSQGGTRQELLAKYHKTRDPKDAEAARKAGATQQELKGVTEEFDQLEEGPMDFLKKVGLAAAVVGALGLPGAIDMYFLKQTPLVQEIERRAEQGDEQAKEDLDNLSATLGSGRTGPTIVLLNRYGFKNINEPKSDNEREQYQETLSRKLKSISDQLLG